MKTSITFLMISACTLTAVGTNPIAISTTPKKVLETAPGNFGAGIGFGLNRGMTDYHRPNNPTGTYTYTNFSVIPHAIIPLGDRFSVIPGLGINRSHTVDKDAGSTDEYSESGFEPMLDFIRWCSDPCDRFQTYTGIHVERNSAKGTYENSYTQGSTTITNKYDSKYTSTGISLNAGAVYNVTDRIQLFGTIDILGYSRSKRINDTKNSDVYSMYSGVTILNEARAGIRVPF